MDAARRALYEAIAGGPRAAQRGTVPVTDDDGRLLGPFSVMLLTPGVGDAVQKVGAVLRFESGLTARERELAILAAASSLRSGFEWLAHEPAALAAGITAGQADALRAGRVPDGLGAEETLICRLVMTMARDRSLGDSDYSDGVTVLGREKLAEITWLAGYYGALALALAVFRPELPESFPPDPF
jgi:alkylhydroperoxidase family enzyme